MLYESIASRLTIPKMPLKYGEIHVEVEFLLT